LLEKINMRPLFFDIHSHLNDEKYNADQENVISRMKEAYVWTTVIGTDVKTSEEAVLIAQRNDGIFACIGVHPRDDAGATFDENAFEKIIMDPKTVAIGECGLDYFRITGDFSDEKKRQKNLFERQLAFAVKYGKPLMLHSRDAYGDTLDILEVYAKQYGEKLRGNAHFFAGDLDIARRLFSIGFSISFTGVVTFSRDYDEVIRFAPQDKIMSETDAPYVAPIPYRGTRNEPANVCYVADFLASVRGSDKEVFRNALVDNALRFFSIDCK